MKSTRPVAMVGAAVALTTAMLGGCGGETSSGSGGDAGPALAAPINLADCTDWNEATPDERLGTIEQIRNYVGGPVSGTGGKKGVVLDDDEAYELFENYCANEFARGFRLYKLYSRAAAFSGR